MRLIKKKKNRKRPYLPLLFITLLLLSGCWDSRDVKQLSIITALTFDLTDEKQIEVTAQIFVPKALSSGGGQQGSSGGSGEVVTTAGQVGTNITDALSKLQAKLPRQLFWGQTKVFIFGEKLAEEGLQEHLDFLQRQPDIKGNAFVYVSEGEGKSILDVPANIEQYSSEVIRDLTDLRIGMQVTLQDLDTMLIGVSQAAALPYARVGTYEKTSGETIQYVHIDGSAIFRKDKMIGTITEEETRGILWLRDEIKEYTVSEKLEGEEGLISIRSDGSRVKLHPEIKNGKWKMRVAIDATGWINQNGTTLDSSSPAVLKRIEEQYKTDIENRINLALGKVQHEFKADVTNFAKEFYRKYPKQMRKEKQNWNEKYPEVEVTFDIKTDIIRQGDISEPGSLPSEEVKKN